MRQKKFETNTLYFGDNLEWMKQWPEETVDLIYLDPPFNSNADYNKTFGTGAQIKAYSDTWQWGDQAAKDRDHALGKTTANIAKTVEGFEAMLPQTPMLAYLCHLAPRLHEMHRLLKPTGSLYLHCDDTSGHYIKILLDAVFRPQNYKNHITWRRATSHNDAKRFGRITDFIFFYTKSDDYTWNGEAIAQAKTKQELDKAYPSKDERGRFRSDNLTGPLHGAPNDIPSTQAWRQYDIWTLGRCWAVPLTGDYAEYIEQNFIPNYRQIKAIHDRLDALDKAGLIHHPEKGKWPGLKRYADADKNTPPQNLILRPIGFTNYDKGKGEYLGFQTQKREALVRKFVLVSSNPGDVVLDPYCGCGTTVHVCRDVHGRKNDKEEARQFIGIDITHISISTIEQRFRERLGMDVRVKGSPEDLESAQDLFDRNPFQFEAWAVSRVRGLLPNEQQTGDQGVDGIGYVAGEERQRSRVIAQVKGGKKVIPAMAREIVGTLTTKKAVLGLLIVLRNNSITPGLRKALALGTIKIQGREYPKAQIFSIEDYFNAQRPTRQFPSLPTLISQFDEHLPLLDE